MVGSTILNKLDGYVKWNDATYNVLLVLLGATVLFGGTWLITEIQFWLQARDSRRFQRNEPPTLPYTIPWLGLALRFRMPLEVYRYAGRRARALGPVKVRFGTTAIYVISSVKSARTIFRSGKATSKSSMKLMLCLGHGLSQEDSQIFTRDVSGHGVQPYIDIPSDQRINKDTHELAQSHLCNTSNVKSMTERFIDELTKRLDAEHIRETTTVGVYDFLKRIMLESSMTTLAGSQLYKLNPNFNNVFWNYDSAFLRLIIRLPRFMNPEAYAARDVIQKQTEHWLDSAFSHAEKIDRQVQWEEHFGSSFIRELAFTLQKFGISRAGQATLVNAMFWAGGANVTLSVSWIILESLQRPGLLERLREEVSAVATTGDNSEVVLDIPRLVSECPLLLSMYLECLRTRASSTVTRGLDEDLECEGYLLKKGNYVMVPTLIPMNDLLFSLPGYPSSAFFPERFIKLKEVVLTNPNDKSQYEQAMKPEHFFPYGGGGEMCLGRFVAKQEVFSAIALIILKLDIQPVTWTEFDGSISSRPALADETSGGAGLMKPTKDMRVKLTRVR